MSKIKSIYRCQQCHTTYPKWAGQCSECSAWNSIIEETQIASKKPLQNRSGYAGNAPSISRLNDIKTTTDTKFSTGITEFDRVLGGGIVAGSVILIGGDPGIGKSTILLQTACLATLKTASNADDHHIFYITGEESLSQVALRAQRLELDGRSVHIMAETNVETICAQLAKHQPKLVIIDSIQTLYTETLQSAPGGVSQIRESAAMLTQFAKATGTAIFLVGHVTKEGALAGPRVLEHIVDCVLYFEGETDSRYRLIRAIKNRFGTINELGIFAMTEKGLREVANPSAIFLSRYNKPIPGSVIMATRQGTRPLLLEVQALVDEALGQPRRITLGIDQQRLFMLLAILHRHGGVQTHGQDVFVNIVGGIKLFEPASDLAVIAACMSSIYAKPFPTHLIVFGEVGLAGELRPVAYGAERLKEAQKHGFKYAVIPKANAPKKPTELADMRIYACDTLLEAITHFKTLFEQID